MNRAERFDERVETGLDALADPRFPDYFDDVLAVTSRTRQRPAWTFPGRWLPMDITRGHVFAPAMPWRAIVLLLVLALLLAVAAAIVGSRARLPAPFGLARNGVIAYDAGGDIYTGDPVTGQSRAIVTGPDNDVSPAFSPDGTLVVFARLGATSETDLVVVRSDGSGPLVLNSTPIVDMGSSEWAPNSRSFWFTAREAGILKLHEAQINGSGVRVVETPGLDPSFVTFRPPSGQELLFRGQSRTDVGLYTIKPDGTGLHRVIAPDGTPIEDHDMALPRYSPDGTRIAYQHWDWAVGIMHLHVANADGSNDRVLSVGSGVTFAGWPAWSPDGKRIVLQRGLISGAEPMVFGAPDVIVNADGTGTPMVVGPSLPPEGRAIDFSPDGTKLLMSPNNGSPQVIYPAEGGPTITPPWTSNSGPAWQRLALDR